MTKTQEAKRVQYGQLEEVFRANGLPIATRPPMLKGVKRFRAALKGLEEVAGRALPEEASSWEKEDHAQLLAAAFDAVDSAIKDEIVPHLEFFETTAPRFFGAVRSVLVSRRSA